MNDGNIIYYYYLKNNSQIVNLNSSFLNANLKNDGYGKHLLYKFDEMSKKNERGKSEQDATANQKPTCATLGMQIFFLLLLLSMCVYV